MKTFALPTLTLISLFSAQLALAANPCGNYAGSYTDYDTTQFVTRTITRYKKGTNTTYTYSLAPQGFAPADPGLHDGETYSVHVTMDGKSAVTQGQMGCTNASVYAIDDGNCVDPQNETGYGTISSAFFTYAANGDHLNVWEGDIRVLNPHTAQYDPTTHYHFNEKKFSEMTFQ